jgi:predicted transcriptional regulator
MLYDRPMTVSEVAEAFGDREEEEVVEAIRWMVDNGVLELDGEVLKNLKTPKKRRAVTM